MKNWKFLALIGLAAVMGSCAGEISETDYCPDDPDKTVPGICGCGVSDEDLNKNGIADCLEKEKVVVSDSEYDSLVNAAKPENVDLCPEDSNKTRPGLCGCGQKDDVDPETGVAWCLSKDVDLCPDDPEKTTPGVCGCGNADTDTDGDNVPDCLDVCENDPQKALPGLCGCNVEESIADSDGDGVIDCLDACPFDPKESKDSKNCRWAIADAAPACEYYDATISKYSETLTRGEACKALFADLGLNQSLRNEKGDYFCVKRVASSDNDCKLGETAWSQGNGFICAVVGADEGCFDGYSSRSRDCSSTMCSLADGSRVSCGDACVAEAGPGSRAWCFEGEVTCSVDKPNACSKDGSKCAFGEKNTLEFEVAYQDGCASNSVIATSCANDGKACVVDSKGKEVCVDICKEADLDNITKICSTGETSSVKDEYTCVMVGKQYIKAKTSQSTCIEAMGSAAEMAQICNEKQYVNSCDGDVARNCEGGVIKTIDCAADEMACYVKNKVASCIKAMPGSCTEIPNRSVCQTIDGHDWRVYCEDGVSVEQPSDAGTLDCTALGMICIETTADAYCDICSETNLSKCTDPIPDHSKRICALGWFAECSWQCDEGYALNEDGTACVEVPEPV